MPHFSEGASVNLFQVIKNSLPRVAECIQYVESLGYKIVKRKKGLYIFRDTTGKRPAHNQEMWWNLEEMRHAVKHGC